MSTQAQQFPTLTANPERRFYPRIAPQAPIFLAFNENKTEETLLLNLSENGLLVSTPNCLRSNFVTRLSLPLQGLPKPVQVTVRVVWASETQNLAGIQLLDLSEHDRQQIRKWAACQSASTSPPGTHDPLLASSSATCAESRQISDTFAGDSFSDTSTAILPLAEPEAVSKRAASTTVRRAFRIALLATACLAAAVLLIKAAPRIPFPKFSEYRRATTPAATLAKNVQTISDPATTPINPRPEAPAPTSSPAPSPSPSKTKTPAAAAPAKPEPQQIEQATADDDADSTGDAPEDQRSDSSVETNSSAPPESTSVVPEPSAPAKPVSAPDAKSSGALASTAPPTPSSAPPSSPTVAPARPTLSPRPLAPALQPVIQMDAPPTRAFEVHLPSGYHSPFFNLPGERVIESPAFTMHIQRSVHMPATHTGWPLNRNKKVVVGELISRVDPPPAQISSGSDASVRVKLTISKDGRLASVNQILGPPNLVPAVTKALHEWRYQPTLVDGNAVETQCYVVFQFHAPSYRAAKR